MESLTSVETLIQAGLVAATLGLALRSMTQRGRAASSSPTGEAAWSAVAVTILLVVAAVAGLGGAHGL